jgi:2-C-methyl-D-erythritol 4-phosphate cytidylyltransferase
VSDVPGPDQVAILIPAAGSGARLGLGPKATAVLHGRPVLDWVVDKARQLGAEVVVACAAGVEPPPGCVRVEGGATRQQSVERLVERATAPWLLLWDAASPFASLALARRVLAAARQTGVATACLPSEVPWLVLGPDRVREAHPAGHAGLSQTPQAYTREILREVTQRAAREQWTAQSTTQLVLRAGYEVVPVTGEKLNLKLTTPEDWLLAQALLARLQS